MGSMKEIAACILTLMFSVAGQAQIIEVASVRRHAPHDACSNAQVLPGGTVKVGCVSLENVAERLSGCSSCQADWRAHRVDERR